MPDRAPTREKRDRPGGASCEKAKGSLKAAWRSRVAAFWLPQAPAIRSPAIRKTGRAFRASELLFFILPDRECQQGPAVAEAVSQGPQERPRPQRLAAREQEV